MSDTTICNNCGNEVSLDDVEYINDEAICNSCLDDIRSQEPEEVQSLAQGDIAPANP